MKRWKIVYDSYCKAVEQVYAAVQPFVDYSLVCDDNPDEHYHMITLKIDGTQEGYRIDADSEEDGKQYINITAQDEIHLMYAASDFRNKYIPFTKNCHQSDPIYYFQHPFVDAIKPYHLDTKPRIKQRGIWTWGYVICDYKRYIDNMVTLKLNTLIIWNDYVPANMQQVISYAHENGISIYLGFAWGWDQDCKEGIAIEKEQLAKQVIDNYRENYAHLGCDGIYFQSFTELNQEDVGGVSIAEAVTEFVNLTASRILETDPHLKLLFGLHANSVKRKLDVIQKVDPRISIIWENLGSFPYANTPNEVEHFTETLDLTRKTQQLRENGDFGVVLKGVTLLNWATFEHQEGSFLLGVKGQDEIDKLYKEKQEILRYVQSYWIRNAKYALEIMKEFRENDMVTALNEDCIFEEIINYPMALYAQMMWDSERSIEDILCETALMPDVTFV